MVSNLIDFWSHPDKKLEKHILGVHDKAVIRMDSPLVRWAALFHDLGKINPNFQVKLDPNRPKQRSGYDEHAYLSAWGWMCFIEKNYTSPEIKDHFSNDEIRWKIVMTLIAKHHGNLPDFDRILKSDPMDRLKDFVLKNTSLPFSAFLNEKLSVPHSSFDLKEPIALKKFMQFSEKQRDKWFKDAIDYYLNTQFAFASLVEADKRDASDKYLDNYYHLPSVIDKSILTLSSSLNAKWIKLAQEPDKSALDILRTEIREEAVANIRQPLLEGQRVFTLTAPTGAGKTFTLLALAAEVQKVKAESKLSILYSIPFLSITEQVEEIARGLFAESFDVLTASSKSKNELLESIIEKLDENPEEEDFKNMLKIDFITQTFDHPFIVTTFVQFFETLLSHRNSTLMKLPNFSKRIFLIDEIQALPPRLYIFLTAWLEAFCRKFDSYAVLSTATMPNLKLPRKASLKNADKKKPELLFKDFEAPTNFPKELITPERYFSSSVFNRYAIHTINPFEINLEVLVQKIKEQEKSCLIILNTIKDSRALYQKLREDGFEPMLLNTHFLPVDRKEKIKIAKAALNNGEKVILVSTALIEAGVDIDFPVVFRDLCPLPSLIQSAGRCNRNKKLELGTVYFFHLKDDNGKSGAYSIYRDEARLFLDFSRENIPTIIEEKDLFNTQGSFFTFIKDNLSIGDVEINGEKANLVELVNEAKFEQVGKFKLIDNKSFGLEYNYFIRKSEHDRTYDKAVDLLVKVIEAKDFRTKKEWKIQLAEQLKEITERTVTIRVFNEADAPISLNKKDKEYFDIRVLANLNLYSFERGFDYNSSESSLL